MIAKLPHVTPRFFFAALLACVGSAAALSLGNKAASPADIERAAEQVAAALNGVLKNCPADFDGVGTSDKRCVGATGDVETLRLKLSPALSRELYGVWRSRDDQRSVFNWLMLPSGPVYLRLEPDQHAAGRSLIYLDAALSASEGKVSGDANDKAPEVRPNTAQSAPTPTKLGPPPAVAVAPSAPTFTRLLKVQMPRLHGADVLSVQNRLIALSQSSGEGDGWYGPNTAKSVSEFQSANGLAVTGQVDKVTWQRLFSPAARKFGGQP